MAYRHKWGDHRVYYHDEGGRLRSVPAPWTTVIPADPWVVLSAGRSPFQVKDLLELLELLATKRR